MGHSRANRRLAIVATLAALAATACGAKAPNLYVEGLNLGKVGVTGGAVEVRFRVQNPNPEPLRIERMEYELFVNGNRIGRGYDSAGVPLVGFGEGKITSRLNVNFLALPGAVREVLRHDRVKARVKGRFYTSGHYGEKRLGFDSDAEVELNGR
jgi:LEA14-like dessication related protein